MAISVVLPEEFLLLTFVYNTWLTLSAFIKYYALDLQVVFKAVFSAAVLRTPVGWLSCTPSSRWVRLFICHKIVQHALNLLSFLTQSLDGTEWEDAGFPFHLVSHATPAAISISVEGRESFQEISRTSYLLPVQMHFHVCDCTEKSFKEDWL